MSESAPDAVGYVVNRAGHVQETTENSPAAKIALAGPGGMFRLASPFEIERHQTYMNTKEKTE